MRIWTLAGFADVLHCEVEVQPDGCALGIRMGDEWIVTEWLRDERAARARAAELRQRYVDRGWCGSIEGDPRAARRRQLVIHGRQQTRR